MSDDVRTRSLSDEAERLKAELERRDLQRSQLQHREATLSHWLAEVERERDALQRELVGLITENDHLRQLAAVVAMRPATDMPERPEQAAPAHARET